MRSSSFFRPASNTSMASRVEVFSSCRDPSLARIDSLLLEVWSNCFLRASISSTVVAVSTLLASLADNAFGPKLASSAASCSSRALLHLSAASFIAFAATSRAVATITGLTTGPVTNPAALVPNDAEAAT